MRKVRDPDLRAKDTEFAMVKLVTSPRLLETLRAAAGRILTRDEIDEQRVSFVYGQLSHDNSITREQIREMLQRQAGEKAAA